MQTTERPRGLPSIHQARRKRARATWATIPPRLWGWFSVVIAVWAVLYWKHTQSVLESRKAALFARQRGVQAELGARFDPLRDRIEGWTVAAAGPFAGDRVDADLKGWDFRGLPGIYLRLRASEGVDAAAVRKAADASLRDGFTACLFHEPNGSPTAGPACTLSHECSPGTFCNEVDHCAPPAQPYNLRAAYRGTRILGDEWSVRLREGSDDMQLRLFEREFEAALRDEVPLVIDLLTRAQFFLVVLDEEPPLAAPAVAGDAAAAAVTAEAVQAVPHFARVALWRTRGNAAEPALRLRREVDAHLIGGAAGLGSGAGEAAQRQANSCQLALDVERALAP